MNKKIKITSFNNKNIITSNNFSRSANVVFAEFINNKEYNSIAKTKETCKVASNNEATLYFSKVFELKENDVIFCHTLFVESLFTLLENITEFKNLKLITSQSDIEIGKELYRKKPNCISTWYAVNAAFESPNLIPIPLGLPETRNSKNIIFSDFSEQDPILKNKIHKVLVNFNLNTRYFHRYSFVKKALSDPFFTVSKANLNYKKYIRELKNHKFVLVPWGNGIDTHRLWEALYAGAIPITVKHNTFRTLKGLPIQFISSIREIDISNFEKNYLDYKNYEKLNIEWWISLIQSKKVSKKGTLKIDLNIHEVTKIKEIYDNNIRKINFKKKFYTFARKIHKKSLGIKVNKLVGM